jgi:serine protease
MNSSRRVGYSLLPVLCATVVFGAASAKAEVRTADRRIPGRYIVVLNGDAGAQSIGGAPTTAQLANQLSNFYGGRTERSFGSALRGFEFRGSSAAAENLSRDPRVAYVAEDGVVEVSSVQNPAPSWGLDRIDQRASELDTEYAYYADGTGVDLYIIDSGIQSTHQDFGGRVDTVNAFSTVNDGLGTEDCHGHGTHVAGIAGGATFGVAKGVTLHPVRTIGCDGTGAVSDVVAGIDWITARHQAGTGRRAVVNISLNNGYSDALDAAVLTSMAQGVVFVVAAGNFGDDSTCSLSPQHLPGVVTVGATDRDNIRWELSDYGPCVDLFAPGASINSTFIGDDAATLEMTGTSMASPHVAGTAALVLAANPNATPDEVQALILAEATAGELTDIGPGSPNLLLFSAFAGIGGQALSIFTNGFEGGAVDNWSVAVN